MATFASAQSGNWSDVATWTGGVVPGNGDTVTINHSVVVDVDTTIGTSGSAGTLAITQASGVTVTVAAGKKLYVRGDYQLGTSAAGATVFKLEAGAGYYFDSSVSGAAYKFIIGGKHYQNPVPRFEAAGTVNDRAIVTSIGSAVGYFSNGAWVQSQSFDCAYTDFSNIYDPVNKRFITDGIAMYHSGGDINKKIIFDSCTFANYGQIRISSASNTSLIKINNCNFSGYIDNANGTSALYLYGTNVDSGGNHTFKGCAVDGVVEILRGRSYGRVTGCVFQRRVKNTYEDGLLGFNDNFSSQLFSDGTNLSDITNYDSGRVDLGVEINGNYFHQRQGSHIDVHVIQLGSGAGTIDVVGNIWECGDDSVTSYTDEGAFLMVTGGSWTMNCEKNIALKDPATPGHGAGRLVAALPATGAAGAHSFVINFDGNTGAYVSGPLIKTGEGYPGHAGMIGTVRNNIVNGRGDVLRGVLANHANGTKPSGILVPANVKNNNIYNAYTGTNGYGYDGYNAADQVGDTDISLDPMFFDADRRLRTWDASLGGPGTDAHAIAELAKLNTPDHDSRYTVENLMAWVRAGFAPTNIALLTAGYDGGYIGAVEPVNPDDTAPVLADATATATGPTTATASVSTDDGNGTLYFLASTNATETAATVKAALSQSVTTGGEQSVSLSALDPETTYYVHFVQINGAGLESESVVTTNAITTDSIAVKGATITLHAGTTPQANLTNIVAIWWDATTPSGAPDYSTTTASTDASGVLTLDLDATTTLSIGDSGFLLLYKLNVTDHRDSLVFAGRVAVSDIA